MSPALIKTLQSGPGSAKSSSLHNRVNLSCNCSICPRQAPSRCSMWHTVMAMAIAPELSWLSCASHQLSFHKTSGTVEGKQHSMSPSGATVIICAAAPTKNNPMIVRKLHMLCLVMHRPKKLQ